MTLEVSKDVRPPVQMRRGSRALFRYSTGDSDIPSSSEFKDEPAFKPLQGNLAFFRVRASWCPLHLRQQSQGLCNISLNFRCLWKVGLPLQSKPGTQLSSQDDLGCTEISLSCCAEISVALDLRWVSQGIAGVA